MYPRDVGEAEEARFVRSLIAGLQFYRYDAPDEFIGSVRPKPGDRLQLVRDPANPHDANAVQVWFHNGQHMLGHLPRGLAASLAPVLDAGEALRATPQAKATGRRGQWARSSSGTESPTMCMRRRL